MLKNFRSASKLASHFSHERNMQVLHLGNKIIFDVPLHYENSIIVKEVRVETGRLLVHAIKRMDEEMKEQKEQLA